MSEELKPCPTEALDAARRIVAADDALRNARPGVDYRECAVIWRLACAEGGTLVARALLSSPRVEDGRITPQAAIDEVENAFLAVACKDFTLLRDIRKRLRSLSPPDAGKDKP